MRNRAKRFLTGLLSAAVVFSSIPIETLADVTVVGSRMTPEDGQPSAEVSGNMEGILPADMDEEGNLSVLEGAYSIEVLAPAGAVALDAEGISVKASGTAPEVSGWDDGLSGRLYYVPDDALAENACAAEAKVEVTGFALETADETGETVLTACAGVQVLDLSAGGLFLVVTRADMDETEAESGSEKQGEAESETETVTPVETESESGSESAAPAETEAESESETAAPLETESESGSESAAPAETESESGTETAVPAETEAESGSETAAPAETEAESGSETAAPAETETESGSGTAASVETGAESESGTEAAAESETEEMPEESGTETMTEEMTEAAQELHYEDSEVVVQVTASPEANLPEGTVVVVRKLEEGTPEYEEAKAITAASADVTDETVCTFYDVTLEADGIEIDTEEGTVSIQMQFKSLQADEDMEQSVLHIEDTEEGTVVSDVTAQTEAGDSVSSLTFEI